MLDLQAELAQQQELLSTTARNSIHQHFLGLLKGFDPKHVIGVTWKQYIPEYCDGDPCNFTCQGYLIVDDETIRGYDEIEINDVVYSCITSFDVCNNEILHNACSEIEKFIISKNELLLRLAVGLNVRVIITRESMKVEKYDCGY